jgi:hypothetical protein
MSSVFLLGSFNPDVGAPLLSPGFRLLRVSIAVVTWTLCEMAEQREVGTVTLGESKRKEAVFCYKNY